MGASNGRSATSATSHAADVIRLHLLLAVEPLGLLLLVLSCDGCSKVVSHLNQCIDVPVMTSWKLACFLATGVEGPKGLLRC